MLPEWVNVSGKRFNEILSTVTKAKNEGLRTNVDGRKITLDNAESLLKDLGKGILDGHDFKNRYNSIASDVESIVNKASITRSQAKIAEILLLLKEIPKPKKSNEQPDTTDISELESEESAVERRNQQGQGLKILTPDQMLSKLPIFLAQLKAGDNSQNIDQDNLQSFNQRYLKMETIFMNTENSETNEPHRFRLSLADKLNLKNSNKNIALVNLSIYCTWKNNKSAYDKNKFTISAPTWNDTFDLPDGS